MALDLDDDGWEDMPIVRSEPNALGLDKEDEKRYHYKAPTTKDPTEAVVTGNAAGTTLNLQDLPEGQSWRGKLEQDESDYTRLRLEEDTDADEVHMRTRYLFDEEKAMTPLSQMQATKNLLTETQRIAYVGLCKLACVEMVAELQRVADADAKKKAAKIKLGSKAATSVVVDPATESSTVWGLKIMARLYHHMELERDEQKMIESLSAHGVEPMDLVPSLMTTHTVPNPEYDPVEALRIRAEKEQEEIERKEQEEEEAEEEQLRASKAATSQPTKEDEAFGDSKRRPSNIDEGDLAFGQEEEDLDPTPPPPKYSQRNLPPEDDGGDIGGFGDDDPFSEPVSTPLQSSIATPTIPSLIISSADDPSRPPSSDLPALPSSPQFTSPSRPNGSISPATSSQTELDPSAPHGPIVGTTTELDVPEEDVTPVLPGVSTSLTAADENITLDIRWTILCDLFLALIADSVYDARSRVLLERVASKLGLGLLDVIRFEKRVTDSLEIQEGVEKMQQTEVIDGREKMSRNKRYVAIGLATLGGGLVIGLSAGLLAPVIGAALGGALTTIGVTGTTGFLAGAGGAAAITTGGVLTGTSIAGRGMRRRTQFVTTFELKALHNQKRINCFITIPGFMSSVEDDVRLPFSTLDPMVGDVFTALWEPEMMAEMGNALKILTTEVLSTVGQTVLQATVMTALVSALQWPLILTKLSYLIDNPWSNALDRAKAAGLVLADILINRHVGVRPVSLIGFSLGARAIYYCLVELARAKAFGIVQDVYLFGATITANHKTWLEVRSVVAGRFVNGFARNDWVLGYLFRATAAGNTVAGLRPVENIPGLENVDITDKIAGHMSYRPMMPLLLHSVGLPVTADYFDEPEEPEFVGERVVITEAEEEELREAKKKRWYSRKKKATPSTLSTAPTSRATSSESKRKTSTSSVPEYDDDDLPPREGEDDHPPLPRSPLTQTTAGSSPEIPSRASTDDPLESPTLAPTAGFDFKAISQALGKDIDVDALQAPSAGLPPPSASASRTPLERSESTPPAAVEPVRNTTGLGIGRPSPLSASTTNSMEDLSSHAERSKSFSSSSNLPSWSSPSAQGSHTKFSSAPAADDNGWGAPTNKPWGGRAMPIEPEEPAITYFGSDGSISFGAKEEEEEVPKPSWDRPVRTTKGSSVLDNPWS